MNKKEILDILNSAKDENGDIPMRLVKQAFDKLSEPCEDTISRQEAKEAYCKHFCNLYCYRDTLCSDNLCKEVNGVFDKLPPAQLDRKKGEWIQNNNGTYSCSLCHSWIPEEQYHYAQFCLYCGADMMGETE